MHYGILLSVCLLLSTRLFAQTAGEMIPRLLDSAEYYKTIDFEKTVQFAEECERLIVAGNKDQFPVELLRSYDARLVGSRYFSHLQAHRDLLERARLLVDGLKSVLGDEYDHYKLKNQSAWAEFYFEINDYSKALSLFTTVTRELEKLPRSEDNCFHLYRISGYMAAIQFSKGEFEGAINQYLSGIPYYECSEATATQRNSSTSPLIFRNIAQAYLGKRDFATAKEFLDKGESIIRHAPRSQMDAQMANAAITLYQTIASYYRMIDKNDSSIITLKKALPLLEYAEPFRGRIYKGLGDAYANIGEAGIAGDYLVKAEKHYLAKGEAKSLALSGVYLSMAQMQIKKNDYAKALMLYQKSLASLLLDFRPGGNENPALKNILSKKALFDVLQGKSQLLWRSYKAKGDTTSLNLAYKTNALALVLLDSTVNEFSLDRDKVVLSEQSFGAFEAGIRIAYELYVRTGNETYFDRCFFLTDQSKGWVLLENLRTVSKFAGIDPAWPDKERAIKSELLQSEQELLKTELKQPNSPDVSQLRLRYSEVKQEYANLIETIKTESPEYYKLRFDHSVITPSEVQQSLLRDNELLIEFFLGDSSLTVFGFTKTKRYIQHEKITVDVQQMVTSVRSRLVELQDDPLKADLELVTKPLYDLLLKRCLETLGNDISGMIIVPDGLLGYIPFEVFPSVKGNKYFLDDFPIHYGYSSTYLGEQIQKKTEKTKHFFAGFVSTGADPSAMKGDRGTGALTWAREEIKAISEILGGEESIFDPATKTEFLARAREFRILHLAMHSTVNDRDPMLSVMVFSPADRDSTNENWLTAIELYNLQLHADMAVLSACNTGFGELHRGEGIMSFSRAFAYAGVPSALISLWKVPDKATSKIMVGYYRYLKEGNGKDVALQLAKQDFVRDFPAMAHPYYWSGFILTGNHSALEFPSNKKTIILLALFAAAVALFFGIRESVKKNNSR